MIPKKNKWWIITIRERNYFGFRYWWFNYIIVILTIFLFGLTWIGSKEESNSCLKSIKLHNSVSDINDALSSCCTCNLPPRAPSDTFAVDCPDRILAFQVCNENSVVDDNFYVYLNGTKIGELDLNKSAQIGSVFLATTNTGITIKDADFKCPIENMEIYYFNPKILKYGNNTIIMKNVKANNHGNEGSIEIRNYLLSGSSLSSPCKVKDLKYSGSTGEDFTITFKYTRCCE